MAVKEKTKSTATPVEQAIGQIVEKGQRALQELLTFDQEKIDTIVRDMASTTVYVMKKRSGF